jgi:cytochrome c-type biogenesis protein CcmF
MIPELGHFALVLALCVALVQSVMPLVGAGRRDSSWMALARPAAMAQCLCVVVAFGCLVQAFVTNDFTVRYVAENSNTALPLAFRFAAVWGGHEGSVLLWTLILAGWTVAVALRSRQLPRDMVARIIGVMGLVSCGFLLFILFTSDPFTRLFPAPDNGRDLNPLLQDPGMVFHPPILYMGYVGFSVAFAFALSALLSGRLDATWARWSRPWTTVAWMFLTLGIALGSAWAYYVLGWGGWWFWDPVENASFMPWLAGTALIHSLAVTEKRGGFKVWTALLAILAFSLSLLGTFLVRSGVLSSVHAFATDPTRGVFILTFLSIVIGGSLLLFAWRAPKVGLGGTFEAVSRESMLLANNVLLLVAAAAVLLGTLYPLVLDALGLGKLSVGPAYFQAVFVPLIAPALFLMGVGPMARWKQASLPELAVRLRWAGAVSVAAAVVAPLALGHWTPMIGFGLLLATWIAASAVANLYGRLRTSSVAEWPARLAAQPGSYYGMLLAHVGVAVFIAGVTVVNGYQTEKDLRMEVGDTTTMDGYTFRLDGIRDVRGPNYTAARASLSVTRDGRQVMTLEPEKRMYTVSQMAMTEAAIDRGFTRDLYVSLGEPLSATAWSVRIHFKPLVDWIWGGCLLMALGGLLAVADRRYRLQLGSRSPAVDPLAAARVPQAPVGAGSVAAVQARKAPMS